MLLSFAALLATSCQDLLDAFEGLDDVLGSAPTGAVNGVFTINKDGGTVYFSKGNLQYQASTKTWRFAENQYDFVGDANKNIGEANSGWIDLFGWATSGWDNGNFFFKPTDYTFVVNEFYLQFSSGYVYGPKGESVLSGENANADWGVYNAISNGGKKAGLWRTLTFKEFEYILYNRNTDSKCLFAKAQVKEVNGLILFPDNWSNETVRINKPGEENEEYSVNIISASDWTKLEKAGCVFLPASGQREYDITSNTYISVNGVGNAGSYWTANGDATESDATCIYFDNGSLKAFAWERAYGRSVRLVQDIK